MSLSTVNSLTMPSRRRLWCFFEKQVFPSRLISTTVSCI